MRLPTGRAGALAGIGLLAFLARLPLMTAPAGQTPDTRLYLQIADGDVPFGLFRTPGYPLFAAALKPLPGDWIATILTVQGLIGVALAVAIAALSWRWFGAPTGLVAGVVAAVAPPLVAVERLAEPDLLFGAIAFAGAALVAEGAAREPISYRLLAAAGVVFGLAAYVKPSGQVLALAAVLPLALVTRNLRATLLGSLAVALAVAATVLPWVVRNAIVYDRAAMSNVSDLTLYLVAFDQLGLEVPDETEEGRLVARLREEAAANPTAVDRILPTTDFDVAGELVQRDRSFDEALSVQGRLARDALRSHPLRWAEGTAENMGRIVKNVRYGADPVRAELDRTSIPVLTFTARKLSGLGHWVIHGWLIATALLCLAIVPLFSRSRPERAAAGALAASWLLIAVATSATTWTFDYRFSAQAVPLAIPAASAGLVALVAWLGQRVRGVAQRRAASPRRSSART